MGLYKRGVAQEVAIRDFSPDLDPTTPGILLDMAGAQPTVKGFQALLSPQPFVASPLPEDPIGSAVAYYSTTATRIFAGGANHLYAVKSGAWSVADTLATTFGASGWNFAQFNDDVIAVGGAGVTPQVAIGPTGLFSALPGSPPVGATLVLAVNGQVMMFAGNTWNVSAIGSDNNWTPNLQTQAGNAPITDFPGDVVGAAQLYRNVVAFKNQGIWFGYYVGGQSIWSFQLIADTNGTWGQGCVMTLPDQIAFLGVDDFYSTTGYTPTRIPNSLKEWFFDTADRNNLMNVQNRYDGYHAIGYWYFVSKNPPLPNTPDRYVAYNFRAQRWASGYLTVENVPFPNFQPGLLDGFYFDSSNVLQSYTGAPGVMRLRTGWAGIPGKTSQLLRVRPKYNVAPQSDSLQTYHVPYLGGPITATIAPTPVKGQGNWYNLRQYDWYHQVQLSMVGSVQPVQPNTQTGAEITAFQYEFREGGDR